ncbi:hypothetical protein [Diplocloster hominis]|uniref:hypothetical protein n=1 Tax=Diplocloster hominis TaxID=3079010 RepID=UPI0031BA0C7A
MNENEYLPIMEESLRIEVWPCFNGGMTSLMTYGWAETFEEHQACGGSGKKDTAGRRCKLDGGVWNVWGERISYRIWMI